MFHSLLLVEVENCSAKNFFEPFFKVAFVHGYFTTEFFDSDRIADMLQ